MKKNPFPRETHAIIETGDGDSWVLDYPGPEMSLSVRHNWTQEQAEFAAHAINEYEEIVTMLQKFFDSVDSGRYGAECPGCGRCIIHTDNCKLKVILKKHK